MDEEKTLQSEQEKPVLTRDEKVIQLREELRNGRRDGGEIDSTGESVGGYGNGDGGKIGHGVENNGRVTENQFASGDRPAGVSRLNLVDQRSPTQKSVGVRRPIGRPGESNSSIAGSSTTAGAGRFVGRLHTDDPVPIRKEDPEKPDPTFEKEPDETSLAKVTPITEAKRSRGRPRKTSATETPTTGKRSGIPFLKEGKLLGVKEAEDLLEPLAAALQSDGEYVDKGIALYAMDADMQPIWGDLADEEAQLLAKILIKRGQRNAETASAVRMIVESDEYIQVGAIVVPRAVRTYKTLMGSPRPKLRRERREARRRVTS